MYTFLAIFFSFLTPAMAQTSGEPAIPFVDGRWSGGVEAGTLGSEPVECWASTITGDGTTFTLAKRDNGSWHLRLSNPNWQLQSARRYPMTALVDFYPQQVDVTAETRGRMRLEIVNIDQNALLGFIENGHTIDFKSQVLTAKYDLEGSAKAMQRVRTCFVDRS